MVDKIDVGVEVRVLSFTNSGRLLTDHDSALNEYEPLKVA